MFTLRRSEEYLNVSLLCWDSSYQEAPVSLFSVEVTAGMVGWWRFQLVLEGSTPGSIAACVSVQGRHSHRAQRQNKQPAAVTRI